MQGEYVRERGRGRWSEGMGWVGHVHDTCRWHVGIWEGGGVYPRVWSIDGKHGCHSYRLWYGYWCNTYGCDCHALVHHIQGRHPCDGCSPCCHSLSSCD